MALTAHQSVAQTTTGDVVGGVAVEIQLASDSSLAVLFTDDGGLTGLTNPFTADSDGTYQFATEPDRYNVLVGTGLSQRIVPLDLVDARSTIRFDGRAAAVAWVAGGGLAPDGSVISDGIVEYVARLGATTITDMPGWLFFADEAGPDHWGITQNTDETTKLTAMIDYTAANGITVLWPSGHYKMTGYALAAARVDIKWRAEGPVTIEDLTAEPTGADPVTEFFNVATTTISTTDVTSSMFAGGSRVNMTSTAGIVENETLVLFGSTHTIEGESRGQARHGMSCLVSRVISATQVEMAKTLPYTALVDAGGGEPTGTVNAVVTPNQAITVTGFTVTDRASARYILEFTSGASTGEQVRIVDYDVDALTLTSDATNNAFPSAIANGDTFKIVREAPVTLVNPLYLDIQGPFTFYRAPTLSAVAGTSGTRGMLIYRGVGVRMDGVKFKGFSDVALHTEWCYESVIENITIEYANRGYNTFDGTGYGIAVFQSSWGRFNGITGYSCRRTLDVGGTQGASYYNNIENVYGYGAGTAYDGVRFWPVGATQNYTTGSHGGAVGTMYRKVFASDIYAVVNTRGWEEMVRDVHAVGEINKIFNVIGGDGLDIDGVFYQDRKADWALNSTYRIGASGTGKLAGVMEIETALVDPSRIHRIRNVHCVGVETYFVSLKDGGGTGSIGGVHYGDVTLVTDDEGSTGAFTVFRNTGTGASTFNGPSVCAGGFSVLNNPSYPKTTSFLYFSNSTMPGVGVAHKLPGGVYSIRMDNETVVKLPVIFLDMITVNIHINFTSRTQRMIGGLLRRGFTGDFAPVPNSSGVSILNTVLTGTTGAASELSLALAPSGGESYLYLETQRGGTDTIMITSPALL